MKRLCLLVFPVLALVATADDWTVVPLSQSRIFENIDGENRCVEIDLTAEKYTRVQILVMQKDDILENHRLLVGPDGVAGGACDGANTWRITIPSFANQPSVKVQVLVQPVAGKGSSVRFRVYGFPPEFKQGFSVAAR